MLFVVCASCTFEKEIVPELYKPKNDHDAYRHSLEQAGLSNSALGKEWEQASRTALATPLLISTPFAEDFYIDPAKAYAVGYRFAARRGHKIEIDLDVETSDSLKIFMDVFRIDNDSLGQYTHIASGSKRARIIDFEPLADAEYILRLQPELLRGGLFRVEIQKVPALSFPVAGKDNSAIGSLFGAPRDGGRRKHHGVDIFAKRHTPIIAPTEGRIRRAEDGGGLGGKVIWMRDTKRDQTLYFAHLNDILVERGDYVNPGDTIGTVGNTGNARTTPPHLHFGIYKNGPMDPYHFIAQTRTKLKRELADISFVGQTIRTRRGTSLTIGGMTKKSASIRLPKFQIMEAIGSSAGYYRVRLPDETVGYIAYSDVEMAARPIKKHIAINDISVLTTPEATAFQIDKIPNGEEINVLGGNEDYSFIEREGGRKGWVPSI